MADDNEVQYFAWIRMKLVATSVIENYEIWWKKTNLIHLSWFVSELVPHNINVTDIFHLRPYTV